MTEGEDFMGGKVARPVDLAERRRTRGGLGSGSRYCVFGEKTCK